MNLPYDYSRCANGECELRLACLRYLDKGHSTRQVYSMFKPNEDGTCDNQIPVTESK